LNTGELNLAWSRAMVEILVSTGIKHACISPGSRNTPLVLAIAEQTSINSISHFEERSAGYFALGMAKKLSEPVILVCTSGTAAANYFPAIIEANYCRVPLIVITADRPDYLVGSGENQTIHQKNLYGCHVRYFMDVGLPVEDPINMTHHIFSAVIMSLGINGEGLLLNPAGPVHINVPFEEPLIPETKNISLEKIEPGIHYAIPPIQYSKVSEDIIENLPGGETIIICGRIDDAQSKLSILKLSEFINAPIFADPISGLRYWKYNKNIITTYDLFLRNEMIEPELVIRFGSKPTSKILCNKLNEWSHKTILVDSIGRFNDNCKIVINSRIKNFCEKGISQNSRASQKSKTAKKIKLLESEYRKTISDYIQKQPMFEGSVVTVCIASLKNEDNLIIGNSMPIRDADMFTPNLDVDINVYANRGTSGIDGVTSTAMGIAAIASLKLKSEYTMLITGDLAFFYDLSGLYQSMRYGMKLTIVVINNKGGGIFSFLPVSNYGTEHFEEFWLTNPNLSIQKAAQLFDCLYFFADNIKALNESLESSRQKDGVTIIEVSSDMNENTTAHKALLDSLTTK